MTENHNPPAGQRLPFEQLKMQVEAVLFAADSALTISELRNLMPDYSQQEVRLALRDLQTEYEHRSFELFLVGERVQLRTRQEFSDLVKKQVAGRARNLSKAALETLAIVAYRQPVTRAEINSLRQVDSAAILQSLREKELITISGTRKEAGTPAEYRTTDRFLEIFGILSLEKLPSLRSLQLNAIEQKQVSQALQVLDGAPEEPAPRAADLAFIEPEDQIPHAAADPAAEPTAGSF